MKNIKLYLVAFLSLATFFACEDYSPKVNPELSLSFGNSQEVITFDPDSPVFELKVASTQVSNVDRVIEIVKVIESSTDLPGDFTVATTVTIPAGELSGTTTMTFNADMALGDIRKVTFEILSPDDSYVLNKTSNTTEITYSRLCTLNTVEFALVLDRYGTETTWQITQGADVVASGGPYSDAATNVTQVLPVQKLCLPDGDYVLTVEDAYGDGLYTSATVSGSFSITVGGVVLVQGGGNFGFTSSTPFTL